MHTLVHAFCALGMYIFWFQKPAGVRDPTLADASTVNLLLDDRTTPQRCIHGKSDNIDSYHFLTVRLFNARSMVFYLNAISPWAPTLALSASSIVFAAYAAIYMTAWNWDFPTPAESYLWRISCIFILISSIPAPIWLMLVSACLLANCYTCAEVFNWLSRVVGEISKDVSEGFSNAGSRLKTCCMFAQMLVMFLCGLFCAVLVPLFLCARIFIIIESFISLRNVPEGVYTAVVWTDYIPHM